MKRSTKAIAALAISATMISFAHAGWERIDDVHFWATDRLEIDGKYRTVFVKRVAPGKTPSGKRYASVVVLSTVNCQSLAMRFDSAAYYDNHEKAVDAVEVQYGQFETAYPDSEGERIARAICAATKGVPSVSPKIAPSVNPPRTHIPPEAKELP